MAYVGLLGYVRLLGMYFQVLPYRVRALSSLLISLYLPSFVIPCWSVVPARWGHVNSRTRYFSVGDICVHASLGTVDRHAQQRRAWVILVIF